jgi:hypothetical protein
MNLFVFPQETESAPRIQTPYAFKMGHRGWADKLIFALVHI